MRNLSEGSLLLILVVLMIPTSILIILKCICEYKISFIWVLSPYWLLFSIFFIFYIFYSATNKLKKDQTNDSEEKK